MLETWLEKYLWDLSFLLSRSGWGNSGIFEGGRKTTVWWCSPSSWQLKMVGHPCHVLPSTGQPGFHSSTFMGSHVCAEGHQSMAQTSLRTVQNLNSKLPRAGGQKQHQRFAFTDNTKRTGEVSKNERVSLEQAKHPHFPLSWLFFLPHLSFYQHI